MQFRMDRRPLVGIVSHPPNPSIPPADEVKAGRYLYSPVPMDEPPMPTNVFMHYFYSSTPEKHWDNLWGERFPQKLKTSILFSNDPLVVGWGIQITDGPNWFLLCLLMLLCLLISGIVAGVYAHFAKDNQTGVAIGSWLTAVQALGVALLFLRWQ